MMKWNDVIPPLPFNARADGAARVDPEALLWFNGAQLPQEGRAFDDTETPYWRIGNRHLERIRRVNQGVANQASDTSGICYRFATDADEITLRWTLARGERCQQTRSAMAESGLDIYEWTAERGWRFVNWRFLNPRNYPGGKISNMYTIRWTPGRPCMVYLPMFNGIKDCAVGIAKSRKVEPLPSRASGIVKPVVFYGSSITHGSLASRPGLSYTAIAGRLGDFPVVNLGFAGSAHVEPEVCDMLADIDASCYVIDPLANVLMVAGELETRYEAFVRRLHAARPDVPMILSAPGCDLRRPCPGVARAHEIFEGLKRENPREWRNLHWISEDELTEDDGEYTTDGCHPNDWGLMQMGRAHARAVCRALGRDCVRGRAEGR